MLLFVGRLQPLVVGRESVIVVGLAHLIVLQLADAILERLDVEGEAGPLHLMLGELRGLHLGPLIFLDQLMRIP